MSTLHLGEKKKAEIRREWNPSCLRMPMYSVI